MQIPWKPAETKFNEMVKEKKMNRAKDIFTVVILSKGELSTVSFGDYSNAIDYIEDELASRVSDPADLDECMFAIEEDNYLDCDGCKMWLEETRLVV